MENIKSVLSSLNPTYFSDDEFDPLKLLEREPIYLLNQHRIGESFIWFGSTQANFSGNLYGLLIYANYAWKRTIFHGVANNGIL